MNQVVCTSKHVYQ